MSNVKEEYKVVFDIVDMIENILKRKKKQSFNVGKLSFEFSHKHCKEYWMAYFPDLKNIKIYYVKDSIKNCRRYFMGSIVHELTHYMQGGDIDTGALNGYGHYTNDLEVEANIQMFIFYMKTSGNCNNVNRKKISFLLLEHGGRIWRSLNKSQKTMIINKHFKAYNHTKNNKYKFNKV